jgi:glutathione S-transferase
MMMKLSVLSGFTKIKPLMNALGEARNNMELHLDALDEHLLSNGPHIIGNQLTLADISWLVILERLVEADWMEFFLRGDQRPNVQRYWQHLQQTQGYKVGVLEFQSTVMDAAIQRLKSHKRNNPAFRASLEGQRQ